MITAVLTGSTFQSVMDKMDQVNMTFKPLHIFSDLSSKCSLGIMANMLNQKHIKESLERTIFI